MVNIMVAGVPIAIDNRFPEVAAHCQEFETDVPPQIHIRVTDADLKEERSKQVSALSDGYLESVCAYRKASTPLLERDIFLLHSSVVSVDGEGYAFLAPSGVGKTTQTRLWQQHFGSRLQVINGDKPLIRMAEEADSVRFYACGTPWRGKEGLGCNASVPLKAVFFVNRSTTPHICPASHDQKVDGLFRQLLLPAEPDNVIRLMDMADRFIRTVPMYALFCDMTEASVLCAYHGAASGYSI